MRSPTPSPTSRPSVPTGPAPPRSWRTPATRHPPGASPSPTCGSPAGTPGVPSSLEGAEPPSGPPSTGTEARPCGERTFQPPRDSDHESRGSFMCSLPLRGVGVGEGRAHANLVEPDAPRPLAALHVPVVVPAIGIQPDTELEVAVVRYRRVQVVLLQHLRPVEPQLEEARPVRGPLRLNHNLVPLPRCHRGQIAERHRLLIADGALLHPREELVARNPHHGRRHVVVTARVGEVRDELRDVVRLRLELPVRLQPEREAVEARVPSAVH